MKRILTILPTRNRPQNIEPFVAAWKACSGEDSSLLIAIDEDERSLYSRLPGIAYIVCPRLCLAHKLNYVAQRVWNQYDVLGFLGDDMLIRTPGWEKRVLEVIDQKGYGMAYPNDTIQGASLPTHIYMSTNIIKALGWMVPPSLVHLYIDNSWLHIGSQLGCLQYLEDVVMEHLHPHVGKAPSDLQYEEVYARMGEDGRLFHQWVEKDSAADIGRVKAALGI